MIKGFITSSSKVLIIALLLFFSMNSNSYGQDVTTNNKSTSEDVNKNAITFGLAHSMHFTSITGEFPGINFKKEEIEKDNNKLLEVIHWGTIKWKSMKYAFNNCKELEIKTEDNPDLSQVTDMEGMFWGAQKINSNFSAWDTSKVENMKYMFLGAKNFNGDIKLWDTLEVKNMERMFGFAENFNQNITYWNTSKVENMNRMFLGAQNFNRDLSIWKVEKVTNCESFANYIENWVLPKPNFTNCNPY